MEIKKSLEVILQTIKLKPTMLMTSDPSIYSNHVSLIEGLLIGVKISSEMDIERQISLWYQNKVNLKAPNMNWFAQFNLINEGLEEKDRINLLINTLEEFLKDFTRS